ncbi:hypothetical protein ACLKOZ_22305 [Arthrobacter sp. R4]|uniref:hypothetical protein n=1 Tax=Arthrobacter sp. R4 TaxID=644417 RepID=UPI003EDB25DB
MRVFASRAAMAVVALTITTFVAFLRLPAAASATVWAEDGPIFIGQAFSGGGPAALFAPYEGYLHVLPRTIAELVVHFVALKDFAVALAFASSLVVGLVALLTYYCAGALTDKVWLRAAWAAIPVMVSVAPYEILGNTANLHWYLLWLMPWLLFKPAETKASGFLLFAVAGLSAITEVISVVFLPLVLFRVRNKAYWPARAGFLAGAACQIFTALTFPRSEQKGEFIDLGSVLIGWFVNITGVVVYGASRNMGLNILNFGWAPVVVASVPIVALVAYLLTKASQQNRLVALVFLAASLGIWTACLVANPGGEFHYSQLTDTEWAQFTLSRYSAVPSMFILALVPLLAESLGTKSVPAAAAVGAVLAVLLAVSYFPTQVAREAGPSWSDGVQAAKQACEGAADSETRPVHVAPEGWAVEGVPIMCARLR